MDSPTKQRLRIRCNNLANALHALQQLEIALGECNPEDGDVEPYNRAEALASVALIKEGLRGNLNQLALLMLNAGGGNFGNNELNGALWAAELLTGQNNAPIRRRDEEGGGLISCCKKWLGGRAAVGCEEVTAFCDGMIRVLTRVLIGGVIKVSWELMVGHLIPDENMSNWTELAREIQDAMARHQ